MKDNVEKSKKSHKEHRDRESSTEIYFLPKEIFVGDDSTKAISRLSTAPAEVVVRDESRNEDEDNNIGDHGRLAHPKSPRPYQYNRKFTFEGLGLAGTKSMQSGDADVKVDPQQMPHDFVLQASELDSNLNSANSGKNDRVQPQVVNNGTLRNDVTSTDWATTHADRDDENASFKIIELTSNFSREKPLSALSTPQAANARRIMMETYSSEFDKPSVALEEKVFGCDGGNQSYLDVKTGDPDWFTKHEFVIANSPADNDYRRFDCHDSLKRMLGLATHDDDNSRCCMNIETLNDHLSYGVNEREIGVVGSFQLSHVGTIEIGIDGSVIPDPCGDKRMAKLCSVPVQDIVVEGPNTPDRDENCEKMKNASYTVLKVNTGHQPPTTIEIPVSELSKSNDVDNNCEISLEECTISEAHLEEAESSDLTDCSHLLETALAGGFYTDMDLQSAPSDELRADNESYKEILDILEWKKTRLIQDTSDNHKGELSSGTCVSALVHNSEPEDNLATNNKATEGEETEERAISHLNATKETLATAADKEPRPTEQWKRKFGCIPLETRVGRIQVFLESAIGENALKSNIAPEDGVSPVVPEYEGEKETNNDCQVRLVPDRDVNLNVTPDTLSSTSDYIFRLREMVEKIRQGVKTEFEHPSTLGVRCKLRYVLPSSNTPKEIMQPMDAASVISSSCEVLLPHYHMNQALYPSVALSMFGYSVFADRPMEITGGLQHDMAKTIGDTALVGETTTASLLDYDDTRSLTPAPSDEMEQKMAYHGCELASIDVSPQATQSLFSCQGGENGERLESIDQLICPPNDDQQQQHVDEVGEGTVENVKPQKNDDGLEKNRDHVSSSGADNDDNGILLEPRDDEESNRRSSADEDWSDRINQMVCGNNLTGKKLCF